MTTAVPGDTGSAAWRVCASCRTQLAPSLLACPSCGTLVHAATLTLLARDAESATAAGDAVRATTLWQSAL